MLLSGYSFDLIRAGTFDICFFDDQYNHKALYFLMSEHLPIALPMNEQPLPAEQSASNAGRVSKPVQYTADMRKIPERRFISGKGERFGTGIFPHQFPIGIEQPEVAHIRLICTCISK